MALKTNPGDQLSPVLLTPTLCCALHSAGHRLRQTGGQDIPLVSQPTSGLLLGPHMLLRNPSRPVSPQRPRWWVFSCQQQVPGSCPGCQPCELAWEEVLVRVAVTRAGLRQAPLSPLLLKMAWDTHEERCQQRGLKVPVRHPAPQKTGHLSPCVISEQSPSAPSLLKVSLATLPSSIPGKVLRLWPKGVWDRKPEVHPWHLGIGESIWVKIPNRPVSGFFPEKHRVDGCPAWGEGSWRPQEQEGLKWSGPGEATRWIG